MISTEQLQKELDGFEAQKAQLLTQLTALNGAISFCQYLLKGPGEDAAPVSAPPAVKPKRVYTKKPKAETSPPIGP